MGKQPALSAAIFILLLGLAMMLFINRLMPIPLDIIITGVGFVLLFVAPFVYYFGRDRTRY